MSRSHKRSEGTRGAGGRRPRSLRARRSRGPLRLYVAGGVLATALVVGVVASRAGAGKHPEPRPGVSAEGVMPATRYASYARIAAVYRQAAQVPAVLDGLYCYCDCSQHAGHYSLLDCFKSDHAAACDVCLSEAAMGHQMSQDGRTLDEIRNAVDRTYGS